MPEEAKRILLVGGGSGGHTIPLFSVLHALLEIKPDLLYWYVGSQSDLGSSLVQAEPLLHRKDRQVAYAVRTGKLNRYLTTRHLGQLRDFLLGMGDAQRLLRRLRPNMVFSKGGAVSVPVVLAAHQLGIPIYTHETDVRSGLANRITARYATRIFTVYPTSYYSARLQPKMEYVGQPIRPEFFTPPQHVKLVVGEREVERDLPIVLVTGGSQGAHRLNELVAGGWTTILAKVRLIHQCGPHDFDSLHAEATRLSPLLAKRLYLTPLITEGMAGLLAASQVVVSRAGGSIMEFAACKKPAILIPLSTAAQDHQMANARVLEAAGAAIVLDERQIASATLAQVVVELVEDEEQRMALSQGIARFAKPDAATHIAQTLLSHDHA